MEFNILEMSKRDLELKVLGLLSDKLVDFKFKKSANILIRESILFRDTIQLLFFEREFGYSVEPHIYVTSFDILNHYQNAIEHKVKSTVTVGNSLASLMNNRNGIFSKQYFFDFEIHTEKDIVDVVERVYRLIQDFGDDYFNNHHSIVSIDSALNENPSLSCSHMIFNPVRCCLGIIAAKLADNPIYSDLVEIYRNKISIASDQYKMEFEMCVNYNFNR